MKCFRVGGGGDEGGGGGGWEGRGGMYGGGGGGGSGVKSEKMNLVLTAIVLGAQLGNVKTL